MKHSTLPYSIHEDNELPPLIVTQTNNIVAEVYATGGKLNTKANAEFIVQACNAHYQLVEAFAEALYLLSLVRDGGFPAWDNESDSTKNIWRDRALEIAKVTEV